MIPPKGSLLRAKAELAVQERRLGRALRRLGRRVRVLVTGCPVCRHRRRHLSFCLYERFRP